MDPLSGLAIAAAVFQFIDLGGKLVSKIWDKYHPDTGKENEPVASNFAPFLAELKTLTSSLREASEQLETETDTTKLTAAQSRFITVRKKCDQIADEMAKKLTEASEVLKDLHKPLDQTHSGHKPMWSVKKHFSKPGSSEISSTVQRYRGALEGLEDRLEKLKPEVTEAVIFCIL